MEYLSIVFDIVGTLAFAVSGAIVAVKKSMDVFGVVILALTTAVGGGVVRDIVLGLTPPAAFVNPLFSLLAIVVGLVVFIFIRKNIQLKVCKETAENILYMADALGLGTFTMTGIAIAETIPDSNWFLCLFVGVITGVGGGILRDLFAGDIPFVFVKFFYASATIIGGLFCILAWNFLAKWQCMLLGAAVIVVLRVLAICYHWKLPKVVKTDNEKGKDYED